ncbi:MAG TPA: two-component regulator propeller domain-containing protein [Thermoanaerobaculia bacterium]|nr:two-component regulator propeller domain-containing protein [Thermoanaerobaculia bacterium]
MVFRRFLLTAALATLVSSSAAGRRLPVRLFTVADGLPQNEINCVFEDSRGFLWVGTSDGLARFDGRDFTAYGVPDGLPHPGVNDILEAPDGSLWLATGAGVARFAATESGPPQAAFRTYRVASEVGEDLVFKLHRDRRGRIWAGGSHGLFVLQPGGDSFRLVPLDLRKPAVSFVNAVSFSEGPEGDLWVGTAWGLSRVLEDGHQMRYLPSDPQKPRGVRDVHLDSAGRLWIGWDRDLMVYWPPPRNGESEVLLPTPRAPCLAGERLSLAPGETCEILEPDGPPDFFHSIEETGSEGIRLLAGGGLFLAAAGGLRRDETAAAFAWGRLTCLLEDRHGNSWVGTQTAGLLRIARSGFSTYGSEDGLSSDWINSVFEAAAGALCVSTNGGAVHRLDGDRFLGVRPALPPGIGYLGWGWDQIVLQDHLGEWWYATGQGLARYSPPRRLEDLASTLPRRMYTKRDGLPGDNIFRVFEDSRGDIWIATIGAGEEALARWERSTGRIRVETDRAELVPISAIGEDRTGSVWVGSYVGGLARFRRGRFELLDSERPLRRGFVSQIFRDSRGRIWIATRDAGLIRVDDPSADSPVFRRYGRAEGLSSDRTNGVTEDFAGALYVATSRGIDRLDPASGRVRHYTAAEGLASTKSISAFRDRAGRLWFGTIRGLLRFDPGPDTPEQPPRVFVRGVEAGGKRQAVPASGAVAIALADLPSDRNHLRIEFFSPTLAPAEQIRFRYRLEGRGGGWSQPSSDASVQYASLPAGRYAFRVEAITSSGTHSVEPASVEFRILPPLWRRWWFLAAAGAALAASLAWLHRQRVERLLAVERVRSRIAADLHDDLGTSLYRISILSELAGRQAGEPAKDVRPLLSDIGQTARDLIESAGDMVWAVDPRHDNLGNLTSRVRRYASEMLEARGVAGSLESPERPEEISLAGETRRQLYLIFKEAIRNALRHGHPSHVALGLAVRDGHLAAEIRDDGRGLPESAASESADEPAGYGLSTMKRRAESLGGKFQVTSRPGEGTRILIEVPLKGGA